MLTAWRLVEEIYAADAFSGDGARLNGGRWNSPGRWVTYCAGTASLAVLEVLANLVRRNVLEHYALISCTFDESLVTGIEIDELPENWRAPKPPPELKLIGDEWIHSERSAVLSVPSVIVEHERNYLINPIHSDFKRIELGSPKPFRFDLRVQRLARDA